MRLWGSIFIFFPNFDRLITLCSDHPHATSIELDIENGSLALKRARLYWAHHFLEAVAALPVVELKRSIIAAAHKYIVII